jgi:hypothetical protein
MKAIADAVRLIDAGNGLDELGHEHKSASWSARRPPEPVRRRLDPFLGSGSTLIAAENTGRICRGVELDPLYVDVIVRRYEAARGEAAVLVETGETFEDLEQRRARERASGTLMEREN